MQYILKFILINRLCCEHNTNCLLTVIFILNSQLQNRRNRRGQEPGSVLTPLDREPLQEALLWLAAVPDLPQARARKPAQRLRTLEGTVIVTFTSYRIGRHHWIDMLDAGNAFEHANQLSYLPRWTPSCRSRMHCTPRSFVCLSRARRELCSRRRKSITTGKRGLPNIAFFYT